MLKGSSIAFEDDFAAEAGAAGTFFMLIAGAGGDADFDAVCAIAPDAVIEIAAATRQSADSVE